MPSFIYSYQEILTCFSIKHIDSALDNSIDLFLATQNQQSTEHLKLSAAGWSRQNIISSLRQHVCYFLIELPDPLELLEASQLPQNLKKEQKQEQQSFMIKGLSIWQVPPLSCDPQNNQSREAELLLIEIAKPYQKKGLGKQLLRHNFDDLWQNQQIHHFFLEVRASNDMAKKMYQDLGFEVLGRRKNYYPSLNIDTNNQNREDAIIMRFSIKNIK